MKLNLKSLAALAAFAAAAFTAHAATAGINDIVVGFKQTGATNDVMIDFGDINSYTAPGTYSLGNYSSILTSEFGAGWSSSSTMLWGAAASWKDPAAELATVNYVTAKWTSNSGTLGVANSTAWAAKAESQLGNGNTGIGKAYTGLGTYSVGVAESISTASLTSWKAATTTGAAAFGVYNPSATFNNTMSNLTVDGYSASDLYKVGNSTFGTVTEFIGTFALGTNGDLSFTVFQAIPEPSTYAAILGVATLGFAALRRRKQALVA